MKGATNGAVVEGGGGWWWRVVVEVGDDGKLLGQDGG